MATPRLCSIANCGKPAVNIRGWCKRHYHRWQRHGDPLAGGTLRGEPERYLHEVALVYDGTECLIWPYSRNQKGYANMRYHGVVRAVSRVVCEDVNGPPPTSKHEAAHLCGKGHDGCVTPRHLSWKTPAENHADMIIHGTSCRGTKHPSNRLTEADVRDIRQLSHYISCRQITDMFGLGKDTVYAILRGRSWAWLK